MIFLDHFQSVTDNRQIPQSQKVHFQKPQFFNGRHGKLGGNSFIRQIQRYILIDALFGNDHTCRVRGGMSGHSFNGFCHIQHLPHLRIVFIGSFQLRIHGKGLVNGHLQVKGNGLCDSVCFRVSYIEDAAYIPHRRLCFHGSEGDNLGNLVFPVFFNHIVNDFLTPLIAEVNINIRHADPLRIQKPLKNQIIADRINIRDFQHIGHNAPGSRSSPRTHHNFILLRVIDKIPYNQKIFHIPHLFNGGKLVVQPLLQAFPVRVRIVAVAFLQALMTELPQIFPVCLSFRRFKFRQVKMTELKSHITGLSHFFCIVTGVGNPGKKAAHLLLGFQIELIIGKPHPIFFINGGSRLNA